MSRARRTSRRLRSLTVDWGSESFLDVLANTVGVLILLAVCALVLSQNIVFLLKLPDYVVDTT